MTPWVPSITVGSASAFGKSAMPMTQQVDYMNGQAWWGMRKKLSSKVYLTSSFELLPTENCDVITRIWKVMFTCGCLSIVTQQHCTKRLHVHTCFKSTYELENF